MAADDRADGMDADILLGCAVIPPFLDRVHRDQVHMADHTVQQLCQLLGIRRAVVDPLDERILKGNAPSGGSEVIPAGLHELFHRPAAVHRHGLVAGFIVRRMQGNGQGNAQILLGKIVDAVHQSAGGQGDVPLSQIVSLGVGEQPQDRMTLS